jgi:FKBP-type peptidyl-prolyl cis-trans isomerase
MKKVTKIFTAILALAVLGVACSEHPGFKKDKLGFYYKFYEINKKEDQPQIGDIVDLTYTLRTKDSVLVDQVPFREMIIESLYEGDIFAALQKMHLGDSATFILNADTFYYYFMGQPFPFDTKDLYFDFKLKNILPKEEYEQMQMQQQQEYEDMLEEFRTSEDGLISEYLETNKITVKPTASGLYLIKLKSGAGKQVKTGSEVTIHYTGKFLDGSVFDSSNERGEPIEITAGTGQLIPGWEEALLLMKGGDKCTLLLPSKLAYGSRGYDYLIPPYTPLVFEMEVISVQ